MEYKFHDLERFAFCKYLFHNNLNEKLSISFHDSSIQVSDSNLINLITRFDEHKNTALPILSKDSLHWILFSDNKLKSLELKNLLVPFILPILGHSFEEIDYKGLNSLIGFDYNLTEPSLPLFVFSSNFKLIPTISEVLNTAFKLKDQKPNNIKNIITPSFKLLLEFQENILSNSFEKAEIILTEISSRNILNDLNITFLKIQLYEAKYDWTSIIKLPEFNNLLKIRLPNKVIAALSKSYYYYFIEKLERSNLFKEALETFKNSGLSLLISNVKDNDEIISGILKIYQFAINEDLVSLDKSIDQSVEYEKHLAISLRNVILYSEHREIEDDQELITKILLSIHNQDYNKALEYTLKVRDEVELTKLLINLSIESKSDSIVDMAINKYHNLTKTDKDKINESSKLSDWINETLTLEEEISPSDWNEWLKFSFRSDFDYKGKAFELSNNWKASEWTIKDSNKFSLQIEEIFTGDDSQTQKSIKDCFPFIIKSFLSDNKFPDLNHTELYKSIFEIATSFLTCSIENSKYFLDLIEGILKVEPDFLIILEQIGIEWLTNKNNNIFNNKAYIENNFEIIEELAEFGVDHKLLVNYWILTANNFKKLPNYKIDNLTYLLWKSLGIYIGLDENEINSFFLNKIIDEKEIEKKFMNIGNITTTIVTLMQAPAERVKFLLQSIVPSLRVNIYCNTSSSTQLEQYCHNSDFIVLVTKASKHNVFYRIGNIVSTDKLVYPSGRGSSSILKAIIDKLDV